MVEKKIFFEMLIETPATEESLAPSRHWLSDLTWKDKQDKSCMGKQKILRRPTFSYQMKKLVSTSSE
jgi:hypothetical protein